MSYSHRAKLLCPILILTGPNFCVLFSQGQTFVSYSHRAAEASAVEVEATAALRRRDPNLAASRLVRYTKACRSPTGAATCERTLV